MLIASWARRDFRPTAPLSEARPLRSEFHIKPRSQNINPPAILIESRIRCELIVECHVNPFVDFEIIIKFDDVLDAVVRQLTVADSHSDASRSEVSLRS